MEINLPPSFMFPIICIFLSVFGLQDYPPPVAAVPSEEVLDYYRPKPLCEGDIFKLGELLDVLEEAQEDMYSLKPIHLPWGTPEMGKNRDSSLLLIQPEFINGEEREHLLKLAHQGTFTDSSLM